MTDKPLHVQVAEALGWTDCQLQTEFSAMEWARHGHWIGRGINPGDKIDTPQPIPHYDSDWSATGPLIEKYPITLGRFAKWFQNGQWFAILPGESEHPHDFDNAAARAEAHGPTPLIAVCNLILALHKAGKLP